MTPAIGRTRDGRLVREYVPRVYQHGAGCVPPRPSLRTIRAVWAAVTASPGAGLEELRRAAGLGSTNTTWRAKQALRDAGYIDFETSRRGTTRIIVPFVAEGNR